MNKNRGFTLAELIVSVVIIAVLIAAAVPAMRNYIQNSKATAAANTWVTSLNYARSEALTRGVPVSVCLTSDGSSCNTTTNASNNYSWSTGWIVFVDTNGDGVYSSANDTKIRVEDGFGSGSVFSTSVNHVTYTSMGFVSFGNTTFTINATGCTGNNGRVVTLASSGDINIAVAAC